MTQSMALASLTATYTDSEGEDEPHEEQENPGVVQLTTPVPSPPSRPSSPVLLSRVTAKVAKLVSYHDDTVASDEDDEDPSRVAAGDGLILHTGTNNDDEASGASAPTGDSDVFVDDDSGVLLPPEPAGICSTDLQDKIAKLHEKMQNGALDMNAIIQQRKDFRNPSIYEKLIQFCGISELGTNYPPEIYDPLRWGKESFYEDLAKVQKAEMEKRERERKSKVEVMTGTKRLVDDDAKKRKSKWDQPGGNGTANQSIKPAGLVQPSLTSSATGTKGTIISAFGSLPKKPRP